MDVTLEDRIRALEASRYSLIGRINACQTLGVAAWVNIIPKLQRDKVELAERLRSAWLEVAESPMGVFPGTDPASLDLIGQHYQEAIDHLSAKT